MYCLCFAHCRAKQQNLEERQADVEYELRCLLNKPGVFEAWSRTEKSLFVCVDVICELHTKHQHTYVKICTDVILKTAVVF